MTKTDTTNSIGMQNLSEKANQSGAGRAQEAKDIEKNNSGSIGASSFAAVASNSRDLGSFSTAVLYVLGIRLTPSERRAYEKFRDGRFGTDQIKRYEKIRNELFESSPTIVFMLKQLERLNCGMTEQDVHCHVCDEQKSGGFHPDYGIMLCANKYLPRKTVENTISHEMIHAWDHCRFNVDWTNLMHHACSEIRASSLSGECRWTKELRAGNIAAFAKHHQECVKRRAVLSVASNPKCKSKEEAAAVVNRVFESCFNDTRPFETSKYYKIFVGFFFSYC